MWGIFYILTGGQRLLDKGIYSQIVQKSSYLADIIYIFTAIFINFQQIWLVFLETTIKTYTFVPLSKYK